MADIQKPRFSVSITPAVELEKEDNNHGPMTVLHEQIRKSVGGGGTCVCPDDDLVVNGTFADGVSTPVTSNSGTLKTLNGDEELVYIKHTGFIFGTNTPSADGDMITVSYGTGICHLKNGEAMVLPRPASGDFGVTSYGANHVGVEWLAFGD